MRRIKTKSASVLGLLFFIFYFFGVLDHMSEKSFTKEFDYPLNIDVLPLVEKIRDGIVPNVIPINYYQYMIYYSLKFKCPDNTRLRLVILVKSAMENFERRAAIRATWGLEYRFEDVAIRTVFFLGVREADEALQQRIVLEYQTHRDIVQSNFVDSYYNNTIKTMMAFRWANEYCFTSDFYLFSDDDMFISVKNLLRFLKDPANYPDDSISRSKRAVPARTSNDDGGKSTFVKSPYANHSVGRGLQAKKVHRKSFFSGFVFKAAPHRHRSKWYVSLEEYPWDMWPRYVTAGAYVVSNETLKDMYAASLFVKHFRFDDIYLAIVAYKLGIDPFHCDEFHFYKKAYNSRNYKNLIASHGYEDPKELQRVWTAQLTGGKV